MAKTRSIVKRRKAIRNIRKITRTMELIATARFKKALDRATEAEEYTRKIVELAADVSASAVTIQHPLLEKRPQIKNTLLLVLSSNRGLCGGYNGSILREAGAAIRRTKEENAELQLELSGKRAIAYFRYQNLPVRTKFTQFEDKPQYAEVEEIANRYLADYIAGRIDRVEVAYMKFHNAAHQAPVVETLLPLASVAPEAPRHKPKRPEPDASSRGVRYSEPRGSASPVAYEYLPSAANILEELLPVSFKVRLFKCFLDAGVSEQIARRTAMKAATENANDMIRSLSNEYNRARQSQITKEIAEVIGGAESLK